MKNFFLIVLISIYTTATFGIGLKSFYCCDKLKSVTVFISQPNKDKCLNGIVKGSCCKYSFQFFKVKDNHVASDVIINPAKHFTNLTNFIPFLQTIVFATQQKNITYYSNAPPLSNGIPLYIFNCVYLI